MSDGFTADAQALRQAAKRYLDEMTSDLEEAAHLLAETASHDGAFSGGNDMFEEVRTRWDETRHYSRRVLNDNRENLKLAQDALLQAADRYEGVDQENAQAIRR